MIDLDAIRARWGNLVITARGMTFSGDDEPDFPAAVLAIGDLIAEVERLRAERDEALAERDMEHEEEMVTGAELRRAKSLLYYISLRPDLSWSSEIAGVLDGWRP